MVSVSLPEPKDPPFPWYQRGVNGTKYPIPPESEGVDTANFDFLDGWECAVEGNNPPPFPPSILNSDSVGRFFEGYQKGLYWASSNGVVDSFRATEMFKMIPPAVPANDPILPTASEVELPAIPFGKTAIWLEGWQDAFNLRDQKVFAKGQSNGTAAEYREGYHSGVEWLVDENRISVNVGRKMLGLPEAASDKELEEFIPTPAPFDPVKIPSHYNQGKIEVANFIADQQLKYPFDNIVKYAVRAGKKDASKEIEDIEKAAAYLQMAHNIANGLPAVVRDPETNEVVWTLFKN